MIKNISPKVYLRIELFNDLDHIGKSTDMDIYIGNIQKNNIINLLR